MACVCVCHVWAGGRGWMRGWTCGWLWVCMRVRCGGVQVVLPGLRVNRMKNADIVKVRPRRPPPTPACRRGALHSPMPPATVTDAHGSCSVRSRVLLLRAVCARCVRGLCAVCVRCARGVCAVCARCVRGVCTRCVHAVCAVCAVRVRARAVDGSRVGGSRVCVSRRSSFASSRASLRPSTRTSSARATQPGTAGRGCSARRSSRCCCGAPTRLGRGFSPRRPQ